MKIIKINNFYEVHADEGKTLTGDGSVGIIRLTSSENLIDKLYEIDIPPTIDQIEEAPSFDYLEELKKQKIESLRGQCNQLITEGFTSECLGYPKHFDCNQTDQINIQGLYQIVISKEACSIKQMLGIELLETEKNALNEPIYWKGTGELECYEFTTEQVKILALDMKRHVNKYLDIFNEQRIKVLEAKTEEEIRNIGSDFI